MRRLILPEQEKVLERYKSNDNKDITFRISAEKKAKLEAAVGKKGSRTIRILREWMENDKEHMFKKALEANLNA